MPEEKRKFVRILQIELEDLIEDIQTLIEEHRRRKESGLITEYVYRENIALLSNECGAIRAFLEELPALDIGQWADIKDMENAIRKKFKEFLDEHSFDHAVEAFVNRKLAKVLDYVKCKS